MTSTLAVEPPVRHYASDQEPSFASDLELVDLASVFYPLSNVKEILLDSQALTQDGGRRLTTWALHQICRAACPGLCRFVLELSGSERLAGQPRDEYSFTDAIEIYNRVIRRRFYTRLHGHQLVRNSHDNLVEGLVGPRYRRLSNREFYLRTREVLSQLDQMPLFYEATRNGRWMLLRYYRPRTFMVAEGPQQERDRYLTGYHFSNNEVGKGAAKAAAFLLRDIGRTVSLRLSSSSGRVRHLGISFERRLTKVLDGVLSRLEPPEFYQTRIGVLQEKKLGMTSPDLTNDKRGDDLVHQLLRRKLTLGLSRRVVTSAMCQGSYDRVGGPTVPSHLIGYESRTAYDLFNALGREARLLAIDQRETAEQAAYALLTGRFSIA